MKRITLSIPVPSKQDVVRAYHTTMHTTCYKTSALLFRLAQRICPMDTVVRVKE
jgi:hypothetical protein